jgi:N-acetyl-anhydromuramyl-L-alanine amidase AmpD
MTIIDLPADAAHTGRSRAASEIQIIMLHSTEGTDSRTWLTRTSDPPASVHRLIRRAEGEHYKILDDLRVSYNCGYGTVGEWRPGKSPNLNDVTLSVELERYGTQAYTDWQYAEVARLVVEWWGLYGFKPVMGHAMVDPTRRADPVRFDWPRFYALCWAELRRLVQPLALPADFADHLHNAASNAQVVLAELTAMVATVEG